VSLSWSARELSRVWRTGRASTRRVIMVVRTMDDIRKEREATGGTGMGGGMGAAANPFGGGAAAGGNYTTAGGYTPIPDQHSMGGVGPGDVFIDACGETVPVRTSSLLVARAVRCFRISSSVAASAAAAAEALSQHSPAAVPRSVIVLCYIMLCWVVLKIQMQLARGR